jgi:hypothetical protein
VNGSKGNNPYGGTGTTFLAASGSGPRSFANYDPKTGGNVTLMNVLREHNGSAEFHWVAALLNAAKFVGSYPYTVEQIAGLWNTPALAGPSATCVSPANFFALYLEQA